MKPHTKIYFKRMGYDESSFIPCECCGMTSVDIHHIENRKSGGDPLGEKDTIENLMALCRRCHEKYGDRKEFKKWLLKMHNKRLEQHGISI